MGIEPTRPAWKAGILPLNYTRVCMLVNRPYIIAQFISLVKGFFEINLLFRKDFRGKPPCMDPSSVVKYTEYQR